jgi:hypothetical protein
MLSIATSTHFCSINHTHLFLLLTSFPEILSTMLFSKLAVSLQTLAAIPLLVAGAALPVEGTTEVVKRDCLVNARQRDLWVEYGLSRWRTVFSAENTDPGKFCHYWYDGTCSSPPMQRYLLAQLSDSNIEAWTNLQCGYSKDIDGGTWFVDVSIERGLGGDNWYWTMLGQNRDAWIKDTGCRTG